MVKFHIQYFFRVVTPFDHKNQIQIILVISVKFFQKDLFTGESLEMYLENRKFSKAECAVEEEIR